MTITDEGTELAYLDGLGQALAGRGFLTMIVADGGRPRLEVLNRTSAGYSGTVLCQLDGTGAHWFWWTWADRIAPADSLELAAAAIARQLTPTALAA